MNKNALSIAFAVAIFGLSSLFAVSVRAQVATTSSDAAPVVIGTNAGEGTATASAVASTTVVTIGANGDEGTIIASSTASSTASTTIPTTGANGDEGNFIPTTVGTNGDNSDPVIPIIPTTQGSNGDEGNLIPVTQGANGDGNATTTVVATTTPPASTTPVVAANNGGGSSSGGGGLFYGGNSFSSGDSAPLAVSTGGAGASLVAPTTVSCPLITSYMRLGANNDGQQVALLQAFLKDSQGIDADVTGVFDQKTDTAVRAFQERYLSDVMGPWGATLPSGYVYITTSKEINQLACDSPFVLSPSDVSIINAYKAAQTQNSPSQELPPNALNASTTSATTTPLAPEVGESTTTGTANVAAIGNASALQGFWSFIKGIF